MAFKYYSFILILFLSACLHAPATEDAKVQAQRLTAPLSIEKKNSVVHSKIYGVTLDSIENISEAVESLRKFKIKPTVRVVFDEKVPPSFYKAAVTKLHEVSFIMGELVDSYYMKNYSRAEHREHTSQYLKTLGDLVDIWEFGNEVNGEWVGPTKEVVAKIQDSFSQIKKSQKSTALTLYYNESCFEKPNSEMFAWVKKNVANEMRNQIDYVFISYYEDDCEGPAPDWQKVFLKLARLFPNSKLGFGEVGSKFPEKKSAYIKKYYSLKIAQPRFVGGYFWWYFSKDMVPSSKPLWQTLNSSFIE